MISYLNNPIGFYGSSNDEYVNSSISAVETYRSNNKKDRLKNYVSLVKESVKAETSMFSNSRINEILSMVETSDNVNKKAKVYQALRSYTIDYGANKTKNAIANGDALDFYCKYENPSDTQYCKAFQPSTGSGGSQQPQSDYTNYYYIVGVLLVGGLGYYYRKDLKKLF